MSKQKYTLYRNILALSAAVILAVSLIYSALPEQSDLDTFILEKMKASYVPGLAACIVKQDNLVWAKEFGWADIENKIPMTEDTIQNNRDIINRLISEGAKF